MSAVTAVNAITNLEWGHIRQRFGGSGRRHKMTNEPTRERLERALGVLKLHHKLYKIAKHPNPDDLTETAIAQLTYDIERINTLRGDEWDYEPGAEEMRKELSAKYGHAINALMDYNKTVTVTWIGDPDDCPSAICSGCDHDLTIYDWYDKLVFGPRNYCPYCGGRIGKQVREEYSDEDEWEEEV
jgi:DNA-directed RNA polymerase subunit RPC12/RpoP